ncbi:MAG: SMC-Scp complex subunit ScpB [Candidatus Kerfeldbacteria bacterium]|nr:SMC-Scp complex subunit ScpB [Candidatus Kerfeldbacteria bacterium]
MNLDGQVESLLFVASRPMSFSKIASLLKVEVAAVQAAVDRLKQFYNTAERGIQISQHASSAQMVTSSLHAKIVSDFLKEERSGELTRPSLETLAIIAYRGPLPKSEIDLIRGVNCSLILRHLMIRGLITSREDRHKMTTLYEISFDFLRHLGIRQVGELPDYVNLNHDQTLDKFLHTSERTTGSPGAAASAKPAASLPRTDSDS